MVWISSELNSQYSGLFTEVATHLLDVLLNPLKDLNLIPQAIIYAATFTDLGARQKAIGTNAVVEGDDYNTHIGCLDQPGPIVIGVSISVETTSLNKDIYRQELCRASSKP
jgi:hypothetical protein